MRRTSCTNRCQASFDLSGGHGMNYSTIVAAARSRSDSRFIDFVELTKPRISVLVLFSVAAAAFASGANSFSLFAIVNVVLATGFVAASASIANQVIEASSDALMVRTSDRPIPSGRISLPEAIFLSLATVAIGESYLAWTSGPLAAGLGAVTWILYVLVYTPLKKYSSLNTIVGAIPGAIPVLIGWAATKSPINSDCGHNVCIVGAVAVTPFHGHCMVVSTRLSMRWVSDVDRYRTQWTVCRSIGCR